MKNTIRTIKKWFPLLGLLLLQSFAQKVQAQCNPSFTGSPCVNAPIQFNANSPGTSSWTWEFGDGNTSNSRDPVYPYTAAGTYTVKFTGSGAVSCSKSFTVTVKPSPTIVVNRVSFRDQCFEGNNFCFVDSSKAAAGSRIIRATYVFTDGGFYEEIDPVLPRSFCHKVMDPRGGTFDLAVETEDLNGCISRLIYPGIMNVWPKLGVEIASNAPTGCDSTLATITNRTYTNWLLDPQRFIGLKDIAQFVFDFGDGTVIIGDSVTNTEYWTGKTNNGQIKYWYFKNGVFDATLKVTSRFGCSETYTYKAAATNIKIKPDIISINPSCAGDPEVKFSLKDGPIPGAQFLWTFGDPPSGTLNFDQKSWTPSHNYGSGPWMISLRIVVGPCDIMTYDTIQKIGPASIIEKPFVRVLEKEKYQCVIRDSVHFVNNSVFYVDDPNIYDEDSFALVIDLDTTGFYYDTIKMSDGSACRIDTLAYTIKTPRKVLAFNYKPAPKGPGTGDQTTLSNGSHRAGRHNDFVWRLWTLGDNYAPACTTDTKANKNVKRNCNFSLDSLPVHWYRPWDEIYMEERDGNFYKQPARKTLFSRNARKCFQVSVFPTDTIVIPADTVLTVPFGKTLTYNGIYVDSFSKFPERIYDTLTTYQTRYSDSLNLTTCKRDTLGSRIDTIKTAIKRLYRVKRPPTFYASRDDSTREIKFTYKYDTTYNYITSYERCNFNTDSVKVIDTITNIKATIIKRDTSFVHKHVPLTWTVTYDDEDILIPAGVSLFIKSVETGLKRTVNGPKIETLKKNEQFELKLGDTLYPRPKIKIRKVDTTYAQPSFVYKDTVINGRDSFIVYQDIIIDAEYHRDFFYKTVANCNSVTLYQIDTVNPPYCESTSNISLALIPPNAKGLKWESGTPCPLDGANLTYYLTFNMGETKPGCTQQWFEVNYDSVANPNGWVPYKSGGVLAPPPPGLPIPFILPYDIVGAWGTSFVKGYPPGEIDKNRAKGSFTIGLIIGNGPPRFNPGPPATPRPPECMDTAWYTDMFRILYVNGGFEIVSPKTTTKYICAGGTAYFKINDYYQDSMSTLRWNWGYLDRLMGYAERFTYYEPYKGPKGQNWLRNYVVRYTIDDVQGQLTLDTITTAIIREWQTVANTDRADKAIEDAFKTLGLVLSEIPKADVGLYLGDGTFGCVDTTGLSQLFSFGISGYPKEDTTCFKLGRYRYKYTDASKADTTITFKYNTYKYDTTYSYAPGKCKVDTTMKIDTTVTPKSYSRPVRIIEEVLHFRDSSIQGFDTLIDGKDTIPGLYKFVYRHPELVADPCDPNSTSIVWKNSNGLMIPQLFLNNTVGCANGGSKHLNVGFLNQFKMKDDAVCQGQTVHLQDSIRYWIYEDDLNPNFPVDVRPFWETPGRYAQVEIKEVDWDVRDGVKQFEKSIKFMHTYTVPGEYLITIAMRDSTGCRDTANIRTYVTGIKAGFEHSSNSQQCKQIVSFFDTSVVYDPCKLRDTCKNYTPCDKIVRYDWDFGDGTVTSVLKNPSHNYTRGGWYVVTLKIWSQLGCESEISDSIFIFGPRPAFEFLENSPWGPDTMIICVNDSISTKNWSVPNPEFYNPDWIWYWGDTSYNNTSSTKDVNTIAGHRYTTVGSYKLVLTQTDSITGTALRCTNTFPEVNPDLIKQREIWVIVKPIAPADFDISDTVVCPDEEIIFTDKSDPQYTRYQWYFGDGDSTLKQDPDSTVTHKYPTQGKYTIRLVPDYDPIGFVPKCVDTASRTIRVVDVKADFLIDSINKPEFKFRNQSTGAVKYTWSLQKEIDGPLHEVSNEINTVYNWGELVGTFQVCLVAESAEGCLDTMCKQITNNFIALIIPYNVFTPAGDKDGDGFNDLYLVSVKGHEEFEIKIFNRWGELVFETKDPNVGWDGTVMNKGKKECPAGAYFYIIDYKLKNRPKNDGKEPISGSITLIRD